MSRFVESLILPRECSLELVSTSTGGALRDIPHHSPALSQRLFEAHVIGIYRTIPDIDSLPNRNKPGERRFLEAYVDGSKRLAMDIPLEDEILRTVLNLFSSYTAPTSARFLTICEHFPPDVYRALLSTTFTLLP